MSAPRLLAPTTISGGVPTAGAGTLNTIALWTPDGNTLGNSLLTQSGNVVTNASGAIRALGTTQTSPAFTRHDTTTSGIYFPATNEIGFTISNQHAMFISSGRNVGIGTASPLWKNHTVGAGLLLSGTAYNLAAVNQDQSTYRGVSLGYDTSGQIGVIASTGASSSLAFWTNNAGTWAERVRVTDTGNVGIGTASPVNHGAGAVTLAINGTSLSMMDWMVNGTRTMAGFAQAVISQFGTVTSSPLAFLTANTERARIDSSGNVGIGTASPVAGGLTVYGASNGQVFVQNSSGYTRLLQNGTDFYIDGNVSGSAGNIIFRRASSTLESARIDSAGRMCIGTTTATAGRALTTVADLDVFGLTVGRGANGVSGNTAVGAAALGSVTSASATVGVGFEALNALSTGAGNTAVGYRAVRAVTTSNSNTGIGYLAVANMTGASNTGLGQQALQGAVGASGGSNVGIGLQAGLALTTGANNVLVGSTAGDSVTTGSSNIVIGSGADLAAATDSNKLVIGDATNYVATNGGATTYYATAGALAGYIIVRLNGTDVKLPVYAL